ncbi:MAG: DUF1194 domain-containing protein [Cyanobacteria bacterium P01_A01_bin.83]
MKIQKNLNNFAAVVAFTSILSPIFPKVALSEAQSTIPVSVELFLSVDVSGSVNATEYELQKQGYVDAFSDDGVIAAIESLPNGLAVAIETWSSSIKRSSDWYLIEDRADAASFITAINNTLNANSGSGGTDVTVAIESATNSILNNQYDGEALVIDISGDGISKNTSVGDPNSDTYTNYKNQVRQYLNNNGLSNIPNLVTKSSYTYSRYTNEFKDDNYKCSIGQNINSDYSVIWKVPIEHLYCPPLEEAVTNAENNNITINGLPINGSADTNSGKTWREAEISKYYSNHVITSDGFVRPAAGFNDFSRAIKEKLKCEITEAACAFAD